MDDADTEPSSGYQDAGRLTDRCFHVVDVHERVVGHDDVEARVFQGEASRICLHVRGSGIGGLGRLDQGSHEIKGHEVVSPVRKIPGDAAFAAADLERPASRVRDNVVKEGVAVVPVGVMAWRTGPRDPVISLALPRVFFGHCL